MVAATTTPPSSPIPKSGRLPAPLPSRSRRRRRHLHERLHGPHRRPLHGQILPLPGWPLPCLRRPRRMWRMKNGQDKFTAEIKRSVPGLCDSIQVRCGNGWRFGFMRSSFLLAMTVLASGFVADAQAASVHYTLTFAELSYNPGVLLPTSGSFNYDPVSPTFSNFLLQWNGIDFDLSASANAPQVQPFSPPPCLSETSGALESFTRSLSEID